MVFMLHMEMEASIQIWIELNSRAEGGLVRDTMSVQNKNGYSSQSVMTTFGSIA